MKTFQDQAGRAWTVALNVDAIKRVRSLADIDLLEAVGGKLLEKLTSDPVLLCDVLYAICKAECDIRNVTDEDFGRALAGDAIDAATTALLEELVDFFPQARRRVLAKALGKLKTLQARALTVAELRLDSPELEAEMEKALTGNFSLQKNNERGQETRILPNESDALMPTRAPGSGRSFGNSPESLVSIPAG